MSKREYTPNDIKDYPIHIGTIHRFEGHTLEVKVSGRKYVVLVKELTRAHLVCHVIWSDASPFIGNIMNITSDELVSDLGFITDFETDCPEYFI